MAQAHESALVWFQLVDSTKSPFSISSVVRASLVAPVVDLFRDAVKANPDIFGIFLRQLLACTKTKMTETRLKADSLLGNLGATRDDAL
jgi:hypothetical protein